MRRAFGVGGNWAVVDIETVWERYWALLLEELGRKEGRVSDCGLSGDALSEAILELISNGDADGHEGEVGVECIPTKAGGMFLSFEFLSFFLQSFMANN